MHAVVNDNSSLLVTSILLVQLERVLNMTTCMYVHYTICNKLCIVFNMIGSRYNQIEY